MKVDLTPAALTILTDLLKPAQPFTTAAEASAPWYEAMVITYRGAYGMHRMDHAVEQGEGDLFLRVGAHRVGGVAALGLRGLDNALLDLRATLTPSELGTMGTVTLADPAHRYMSKWSAADLHPVPAGQLRTLLGSGLDFETEWWEVNKEPVTARVGRTDGRVWAQVSQFMDDGWELVADAMATVLGDVQTPAWEAYAAAPSIWAFLATCPRFAGMGEPEILGELVTEASMYETPRRYAPECPADPHAALLTVQGLLNAATDHAGGELTARFEALCDRVRSAVFPDA